MKLSVVKFKSLLPILIFCWPFIYLYHYIFPINGQYTAIGNDFEYYYKFKVYLLSNLANLHLPLWSPSEAAGYPFVLSPFAQTFYPWNILLVIFYKFAGGYSKLDHQVYIVFGMAIFALGLFKWLKLLNSNLRAVIFATMVISVSFKLTEILRFTTAIHTAAWYPWILYAITKIFISSSWKKAAFGGIVLVISLISFCTAGYPYYIYYSQFLFMPYFLAFLIKPLRIQFFGIETINWKKVICVFAIAAILSGLICGPYLLGVKNLLAQTTDRNSKEFAYSTKYDFNFTDTIGSLVFPPAAQAEGWYFFSIGGLILIVLYLFKGKIKLWCKLFFVIWIAVISYISYQKESYLFKFLWDYWPGFSSLRAWGRMNIILLPIFAWLLSYAYQFFEDSIEQPAKNKKSSVVAVLILIYSVIFVVQHYLYTNKLYDLYWGKYFNYLTGYENKFIITGVISFMIILLFMLKLKAFSRNFVMAALVSACVIEMYWVGTHTWTFKSLSLPQRVNINVAELNKTSFSHRRISDEGMISLGPNFNVGLVRNWYFNRYVTFLRKTQNELAAQKILLGMEDGQKIFFSKSIDYSNISPFLEDVSFCRPLINILSYNGDELSVEIKTPVAGYLSFIDNWDSNWKVAVDNKPDKIELLFGTFKSVAIPQGSHLVKFYYKPKLFSLICEK